MFTGLVEEIGKVSGLGMSRGAKRLRISAKTVLDDLKVDDSICVSGVCLTVIDRTDKDFSVEAVQETLKKSTLGKLKVGKRVNLERALTSTSRLGGHFVQGHVDGIARVDGFQTQEGGRLLILTLPDSLLQYVIPKGSIAVDGVSLTVAELKPPRITIALIPHTLEVTTLAELRKADSVNIEVDMIGKYAVHLLKPYLEKEADRFAPFEVKLED